MHPVVHMIYVVKLNQIVKLYIYIFMRTQSRKAFIAIS